MRLCNWYYVIVATLAPQTELPIIYFIAHYVHETLLKVAPVVDFVIAIDCIRNEEMGYKGEANLLLKLNLKSFLGKWNLRAGSKLYMRM